MTGEGMDEGQVCLPSDGTPAGEAREFPTLRQVAVVIGCLPACFLIQAAVYPWFPRLSVVASGASMIALVMAWTRRWGLTPRRVFLLKRPGAGVVLQVVLMTGLAAVLLAEVQALIDPFLPMPARFGEFLEKLEGLLVVSGPGDLVGAVIAIAVFPAVSEELLFRGVVLTGLRSRFGPTIAVAGSGVLFALVHLNPWQFVPLALIGAFIGFVVHRTDSLYVGIASHGANNLISLVGLNLGRRYSPELLSPSTPLPPALVAAALALFVAGMVSFTLTTRRENDGT